MTAGFSRRSSRTGSRNSILDGSFRGGKSNSDGGEKNILSALFSRFRRSSYSGPSRLRTSNYEDYRMFSHKPVRHLDSSFDTEDDDDEDELYSVVQGPNNALNSSSINKQQTGGGKPRRNGSSNHLTEIDWDIIGTGLDIDLSSQISNSGISKSAKTYQDGSDLSDGEEQQRLKNKRPKKEYTSLLLEPIDSGSDSELYYSNVLTQNEHNSKLNHDQDDAGLNLTNEKQIKNSLIDI